MTSLEVKKQIELEGYKVNRIITFDRWSVDFVASNGKYYWGKFDNKGTQLRKGSIELELS